MTKQPKPYDKGTVAVKAESAAIEQQVTFDSSSTQERRRELVKEAELTCTFDGSAVFLILPNESSGYRLAVIKNSGEILESSGTVVFEEEPQYFQSLSADILEISTDNTFKSPQYLTTKDNWNSFTIFDPRSRPVESYFLYSSDNRDSDEFEIPLQQFWTFFDQPCDPDTDIPRVFSAMLPCHQAIADENAGESWMTEFIREFVVEEDVCLKDSIAMLRAACDLNLPEFGDGLKTHFVKYADGPMKALRMWTQRDQFSEEVSRALLGGFRGAIHKLESPDEFYSVLKEEELTVADLHELFGEQSEELADQ